MEALFIGVVGFGILVAWLYRGYQIEQCATKQDIARLTSEISSLKREIERCANTTSRVESTVDRMAPKRATYDFESDGDPFP